MEGLIYFTNPEIKWIDLLIAAVIRQYIYERVLWLLRNAIIFQNSIFFLYRGGILSQAAAMETVMPSERQR